MWHVSLSLAALFFSGLQVDAAMYSIGPDASGVPRNFTSITPSGIASSLFNLGDGSLAFNGGLAFGAAPDTLYAIANDSVGTSTLISFSLSGGGTFGTIASLGQGFISGLAYSSTADQFYAVSTDLWGQSTLNTVSLTGVVSAVGILGNGFYGGLTVRPSDGLLYSISGDLLGVQRRFQTIDPVTGSATLLFSLGDGSVSFSGGVAFDPSSELFYAISNDSSGTSTLQSFTLAGGGTTISISDIGTGFGNAGLATAPAPIPEPAPWQLLAVVIVGLAMRVQAAKRRPTIPSSCGG